MAEAHEHVIGPTLEKGVQIPGWFWISGPLSEIVQKRISKVAYSMVEKKSMMKRHKNKLTVTIVGAGGTAGCHITDKLLKRDYDLLFVEKEEGIAKLRERELSNAEAEEAVPRSDIVIMAVPDAKIGDISRNIVPMVKKNAIVILPDALAACARDVALHNDCTFVITHSYHPALFGEQDTPEVRNDFFGGIAKQDIVISLLQGNEEDLQKANESAWKCYPGCNLPQNHS